jgi:hypothetical protein
MWQDGYRGSLTGTRGAVSIPAAGEVLTCVPGVVLAAALHAGVEAEYIRDIICRLQIKPPVDAPESWPWQFKIIALKLLPPSAQVRELSFERATDDAYFPRKVAYCSRAKVCRYPGFIGWGIVR